ncbi:hypothetical protein [Streptomyces prasinopilosus]|uniref:Uncharacterized protein n=1 Tax=Streptomyces prasinopilosus TaxID=67344 RepID=A0A1G6V4F6_9ACTN|nr:hypothetical protein SAMN05216505_108105 [Streptomyces prasinopilosus]
MPTGDCFDAYRRLPGKRGSEPLTARRGVAHGAGPGRVRRVVERSSTWPHQSERLRIRYGRCADLPSG